MAGRGDDRPSARCGQGIERPPTVRLGVGCKPLYDPSIAFSVSIRFRILDHNQGGRRDTHLDIDRKARLRNAGRTQIRGDVDCAYAGVDGAAALCSGPIATGTRSRLPARVMAFYLKAAD